MTGLGEVNRARARGTQGFESADGISEPIEDSHADIVMRAKGDDVGRKSGFPCYDDMLQGLNRKARSLAVGGFDEQRATIGLYSCVLRYVKRVHYANPHRNL